MGFVNIYGTRINSYEEKDLEWMRERISTARQQVLARRKNDVDRLRCALAEMLLWHGLCDIGLDIGEYEVSYEEEKPRLLLKAGGDAKIDFSFSHSGDYVICAISDSPIGVDVQTKSKKGALLSDHVFSETELLAFAEKKPALSAGDDPAAEDELLFRKFWTCKESFIKCASEEKPNLRSVELDFEKMPYPIVNRSDGDEFYFGIMEPDETHTLSFCVHTSEHFALSVQI